MNTLEIQDFLQYLPVNCYGIYPADQIPKVWTRPAALIVNTENHWQRGSHWIAMYVDGHGNGYYFDSFGRPPLIPEYVDSLHKNCRHYKWNSRRLQSEDSDVCGQFCMMFCRVISSGCGMRSFQKLFSDDLKKNDKIAQQYYENFLLNKHQQNKNLAGKVNFKSEIKKISIMKCDKQCCVNKK